MKHHGAVVGGNNVTLDLGLGFTFFFQLVIIILVPLANVPLWFLAGKLQRSVHEAVIIGSHVTRNGKLREQGQGAVLNLAI